MKHLLAVEETPAGLPLYVFGAGIGGVLLRQMLGQAGHAIRAFVDETKSGELDGIPIMSVEQLAHSDERGGLLLIASQHWRAIGRRLAGRLEMSWRDASPIIRQAMKRAWRRVPDRQLDDALSDLSSRFKALAGNGLDVALDALPRHPEIDHLFNTIGPLPPGRHGYYLYGAGPATLSLRALLARQDRLELVGYVDDGLAGQFVDFVDVCRLDDLAADDLGDDPLILVAGDPVAVAALRARGFNRVVSVEPPPVAPSRVLGAAVWPPDACELSVVGLDWDGSAWTPPAGVEYVDARPRLGEDDNAALLRALRQCRGRLVAACAGDAPVIGTLSGLVAYMDQHPDVAALAGNGDGGGGFDLVRYLFGGSLPGLPLRVMRRSALLDVGVGDDGWFVPAFAMELTCRLACDHLVAAPEIPGLAGPGGNPCRVSLEHAVWLLNRLFSGDGFFRPNERLLRYAKARLLVAAQAGGDPAPLGPVVAEVYNAAAQSYDERGQIGHALAMWQRARQFDDAIIDSLLVQALLKDPLASNDDMLRRQRDWAARHAPWPWRPMPRPTSHEPIRVAYNCAFADTTYFRYQVLPFVALHDREHFHVTCYVDKATPAVLARCDQAREVSHLDDAAFVEQVRADTIDILVEVTGFSPGHRYGAMAMRAAPVQVSYINHMGTSGVPNVDWFIGDGTATPPGVEKYFTERIWRVPRSFSCFDYREDTSFPAVSPPPCLSGAPVRFGCFGSGSKLNNELIALWAQLLQRVPESQLVLCNGSLASASNRDFLVRRFARHGVGPGRLVIHPGSDRAGILRLYGDVDVGLDTWPYCGGNTIAESLMMGVPVVTLTGQTTPARYGASLLRASGCAELVADTPQDYVEIAAALARDKAALTRYRETLRQATFEHGFSDSEGFVRDMEAAYRHMLAECER